MRCRSPSFVSPVPHARSTLLIPPGDLLDRARAVTFHNAVRHGNRWRAAHLMQWGIALELCSIQEDYIRGQDPLILPGAEVIGRRIIGTLVPELGPE